MANLLSDSSFSRIISVDFIRPFILCTEFVDIIVTLKRVLFFIQRVSPEDSPAVMNDIAQYSVFMHQFISYYHCVECSSDY